MKSNERWLSSIALIISVLPLICVGLVRTFVTGSFLFEDLTKGVTYELTSSQVTMSGMFCIIPISILLIARTLRSKELLSQHFPTLVIATLILSCVYVFAMVYILVLTLKRTELSVAFAKIDYFALVTSIVCIAVSFVGNFLPSLKPNPVFGVKNHYTMAHPDIWLAVNNGAASALTYIFLLAGVFTSHFGGITSVIIFLLACLLYYIWVALHSYYKYHRFTVTHPNEELIQPIDKK